MNDSLKIKITIADRVYPLTVDALQEQGLRSASKKIDVMMKQFEESYAVRDKQDVLAMCALQFANQTEQKSINSTSVDEAVNENLLKLSEKLSNFLK